MIAFARRAALGVALCLLAAACGSTAQMVSRSAGGAADEMSADGLSTDSSQAAPSGASAAAGSIATSSGPGVKPAQDTSIDASAAGAAPAAGRAPSTGPITVGFVASKCTNCSALSSDYVQPTYSDQQLEQAIVNGINARGGIGGRRIQPVFANVDTADANWETSYQAACSTLTQDHHVAAVLGYSFAYIDSFASCLAKAGVLWINGGYATGVWQDFRSHPLEFASTFPVYNIRTLLAVSSALEDGTISTKSKLGILRSTCRTDVAAFKDTLKPYIDRHRLNLMSDHVGNCPKGQSDVADAAAFIQSSELRMRSEGVDTVIVSDIPLILFAESAESQQWHPKYLAASGGGVYEPYVPEDQLANIHGVGWAPALDLNASQQPAPNAAQKTCLDLYRRGGISQVPPSQHISAYIACDGVLLYARAVALAQSSSAAAVARTLRALGDGYTSPVTLNGLTSLTAAKAYAPSRYRSNMYKTACKCFQYSGPLRPMPAS